MLSGLFSKILGGVMSGSGGTGGAGGSGGLGGMLGGKSGGQSQIPGSGMQDRPLTGGMQKPEDLNFKDILALRMQDKMQNGGGGQVSAPPLPEAPMPAQAAAPMNMFTQPQPWTPPQLQNLGMGAQRRWR